MDQIEKILKAQHKTQKSLAESLNITPQAINNYVKGKSEPDIKTLIKIADYLDVSLDYLCARQYNNNVGYIPDEKKDLVKLILTLNEFETNNLLGYANGLLDGKNNKN